MTAQQLLVGLPEELVCRRRRRVPARRSTFVQPLPERALPEVDDPADPLCLAALEVERDPPLAAEMAKWDAIVGDGLDPR